MKKTLLFACAAVVLVSCGGGENKENKEVAAEGAATAECVVSGDVVYINVDQILTGSELYAKEGAELQKKVIGDKEPLTCRPADLIPPELDKLEAEISQWNQEMGLEDSGPIPADMVVQPGK